MLTLYRRHTPACAAALTKKGLSPEARAAHYRCSCPIWIRGTDSRGQPHRETLNTNDPYVADERKREIDSGTERPKAMTVEDAVQKWITASRAAGRKESSIGNNQQRLNVLLLPWCKHKGIRYLSELTTDALDQWMATWTCSNGTKITRIRILRAFFNFARKRKWCEDNPAHGVIVPKDDALQTQPYTESEWEAIEGALDCWPAHRDTERSSLWSEHMAQAKAVILILRWTGLRISDAFKFEPRRIVKDVLDGQEIYKYTTVQTKTNGEVECALPQSVAKYLLTCERFSEEPGFAFQPSAVVYAKYGLDTRPDTTGVQSMFRQSFLHHLSTASGVDDIQPHRFRDTFAVDLFLRDVPLEDVSRLLGHKDISITLKHYNPWVRARQNNLLRHQIKCFPVDAADATAAECPSCKRPYGEVR